MVTSAGLDFASLGAEKYALSVVDALLFSAAGAAFSALWVVLVPVPAAGPPLLFSAGT